jgi:rhodanese-related sulfurtransferase
MELLGFPLQALSQSLVMNIARKVEMVKGEDLAKTRQSPRILPKYQVRERRFGKSETEKVGILTENIKEAKEVEEITATGLYDLMQEDPNIQIIDVREPYEYEIARIPKAKLIPLGEIIKRMDELDPSRTAYIHCRSGGRSAKAIMELKQHGYTGKLVNLKGGIIAWSDEVDKTVPKY